MKEGFDLGPDSVLRVEGRDPFFIFVTGLMGGFMSSRNWSPGDTALPVEALGRSLYQRVARHSGSSKFADDLTVLAERRLEPVRSTQPAPRALASVSQ